MQRNQSGFASAVLFNLLALSLAIALVVYRTEITYAHGNDGAIEFAVVNPRDLQVEDDGIDDDDEDDPPMDEDDTEGSQSYTVQPGDNLWKIAIKTGVPFSTLKSLVSDPSLIQPGDQITIVNEDDDDTGSPGELQTFEYTVRPGDTLSQIAEYLGVSLESLAAQTDDPSSIYPGQVFTYVSAFRLDTPPPFNDTDGLYGTFYEDGTDHDGYDTPQPPADYRGPYRHGNDNRLPDIEFGYLTPEPPTDHDGVWTPPDYEYGYPTPEPPTDNDGIDTLPDYEYGYDSHLTPASQTDYGQWS